MNTSRPDGGRNSKRRREIATGMTVDCRLPAVDFLRSRSANIRTWLFLACMIITSACEPDLQDDPIPWQPFDVIQLSLNLPEYVHLRTDGNYIYLNDAGVRGIIVYHPSGNKFIAYERNCSFQPNSVCATVEVHSSRLYLLCPCCNSTFDLETGYPTGGAAWRPLRQYETSYDGGTLTITDLVIE